MSRWRITNKNQRIKKENHDKELLLKIKHEKDLDFNLHMSFIKALASNNQPKE